MSVILNRSKFFVKNFIGRKIHSFSRKYLVNTFYAKDFNIIERKKKLEKPAEDKPLPFGVYHTDYLMEIDHSVTSGWGRPRITPYHKFEIDPINSSLHYAVQLFEGMKAYRNVMNPTEVLLFRPEMNMERMNMSARRIGLPNFEGEELIKCIEKMVSLEKDWIPLKRGYALYIRPTFISMTNQLGVILPRESKIFVVLSPAGPYFPTGFAAISIMCSDSAVRAWPGGFGYAKLGANYGPTLEYYHHVRQQGFQQVLWLINDYVTEVGVMNFFVHWINEKGQKELITCPLDGTILPGVIRHSVIELAKEWGINVSERHYTIHEMIKAVEEGRMLEAFGTGTAAIICPIKNFSYKGKICNIVKDKNQTVGELGYKLYNTLLDIQTGIKPHPWTRVIKD